MPAMNRFRASGFHAEDLAPGLAHHVFLISIRGEPRPAVLHRGNPLQPMQVILTGPGDVPPLSGLDAAIGPLPALPAPHHPARTAFAPGSLIPREVTGEILRDASGRLYERIGDHVRPVNRLYTGARGEMIDMTPIREVSRETGARSTQYALRPSSAASFDQSGVQGGDDEGGDDGDDDTVVTNSSAEAPGPRRLRELAHRLTPEPGLWRLVRYADFIDAVTPQLADPRRLQPGHQLACYAQVYELAVTLPLAMLEEAAAHELGNAGKLLPLSYDLCRRLALNVPRPALALAAARQASRHASVPGIVPVGARFLTLRVAMDPTAETVASAATAPYTASGAPDVAVAAPAAPGSSQAVDASVHEMPSAGPGRKCAIPEEYAKPWDMRLSRDEALYDMTLATSRGALQRAFHRFRDGISGSDMKRWHALLSGKTSDEQLWAVKPPRGAFADARIRRWAEQALQLGGYDVARMLVEWEIHWRRKGP